MDEMKCSKCGRTSNSFIVVGHSDTDSDTELLVCPKCEPEINKVVKTYLIESAKKKTRVWMSVDNEN